MCRAAGRVRAVCAVGLNARRDRDLFHHLEAAVRKLHGHAVLLLDVGRESRYLLQHIRQTLPERRLGDGVHEHLGRESLKAERLLQFNAPRFQVLDLHRLRLLELKRQLQLAGIAAGAGATGRAGGSDSPVADVRVLGATATIELAPHVPLDVAIATRAALEHGVWLRPFRNLVYAMPPYLADEADLRTIAAGMSAAVRALQDAA